MDWRAYHISPIDHDWEFLLTVEETVARLALKKGKYAIEHDPGFGELENFLKNWNLAQALAKESGWEGDFREVPCVFWIPSETCFEYGFAFKQDNNGSTFVISPRVLPWIEELAI